MEKRTKTIARDNNIIKLEIVSKIVYYGNSLIKQHTLQYIVFRLDLVLYAKS